MIFIVALIASSAILAWAIYTNHEIEKRRKPIVQDHSKCPEDCEHRETERRCVPIDCLYHLRKSRELSTGSAMYFDRYGQWPYDESDTKLEEKETEAYDKWYQGNKHESAWPMEFFSTLATILVIVVAGFISLITLCEILLINKNMVAPRQQYKTICAVVDDVRTATYSEEGKDYVLGSSIADMQQSTALRKAIQDCYEAKLEYDLAVADWRYLKNSLYGKIFSFPALIPDWILTEETHVHRSVD